MKKLSKDDIKRRDELIGRMQALRSELEDDHRVMVEEVTASVAKFNEKLAKYGEVVTEAASWRDDLVGEIDSYISDKSENWQNGDKGQAFTSWKDAIENLGLEDVDDFETPDFDDLDLDHVETLEQMPLEPEE